MEPGRRPGLDPRDRRRGGTGARRGNCNLARASARRPARRHRPWLSVYLGSAGIVWALDRLGSERDWAEVARALPGRYRAQPEFGRSHPSLLAGESGLLLVEELVAGSTDRDRLAALVAANVDAKERELMWGSPGTMLAADVLAGQPARSLARALGAGAARAGGRGLDGAAGRRRRADLARWAAREGRRALPRDRGQRLRVPAAVRADRGRALARARTGLRDARSRPGRGGA